MAHPKSCSSCGTPLNGRDKFCPNCGIAVFRVWIRKLRRDRARPRRPVPPPRAPAYFPVCWLIYQACSGSRWQRTANPDSTEIAQIRVFCFCCIAFCFPQGSPLSLRFCAPSAFFRSPKRQPSSPPPRHIHPRAYIRQTIWAAFFLFLTALEKPFVILGRCFSLWAISSFPIFCPARFFLSYTRCCLSTRQSTASEVLSTAPITATHISFP